MKKNMVIRLLSLVIIVMSLSFSTVGASSAGAAATQKINAIVRLGIFKGDPDGNLRMDEKIIRSELVTAFVRAVGMENDKNKLNLSFKDIDSTHWAYNFIGIAVNNGMITGYPDNTVGPDRFITYSEALTLIIRTLGYQEVLSSGNWPDNVIKKCQELGVISGSSVPKDKELTREEVASLIYNALTVEF